MLTVWLPMCSTVTPLARGVGGDIPSNDLGQGFACPSPCTHAQGAYGAPTGAVGGAADGRRTMTCVPPIRQPLRVVCANAKWHGRTHSRHRHPLSATMPLAHTTLSGWRIGGTDRENERF